LAVLLFPLPGWRRIKVQLNDGSERTIDHVLLERAIEWTFPSTISLPRSWHSP